MLNERHSRCLVSQPATLFDVGRIRVGVDVAGKFIGYLRKTGTVPKRTHGFLSCFAAPIERGRKYKLIDD